MTLSDSFHLCTRSYSSGLGMKERLDEVLAACVSSMQALQVLHALDLLLVAIQEDVCRFPDVCLAGWWDSLSPVTQQGF